MGLRTRVIACSVVLTAVVAVVPGGRSFASDVATRIVHLRPGRADGAIPFILDLHKHKRGHKAPAPSRPRHPAPPGPAAVPASTTTR